MADWRTYRFVPLRNYTTLKPAHIHLERISRFVPLRNYTTLKPGNPARFVSICFVPLRNYTTLKRSITHFVPFSRFVPLRNYTTLKQLGTRSNKSCGFVPLRNYTTLKPVALSTAFIHLFCTSTKLHYSQTSTAASSGRRQFCTSTKLHYSQTSNLKFASISASTRRKSGYGPPEGNLIPCNFYFYFRIRTGQCQ